MQRIIERIGMDKIVHFGIGGLITALFTLALIAQDLDVLVLQPWRVVLYPIVGTVVTAFVSAAKEVFFDNARDWKDLYAALFGSATVFVSAVIGLLLFLGSN